MRVGRTFEAGMDHSVAVARSTRSLGRSHRRAFAIEAALLTLFLAISLAITTATFASALVAGADARSLSVAVTLAASGADNGLEAFAAAPASAEPDTTTYYLYDGGRLERVDDAQGGDAYVVRRTVTAQPGSVGELLTAEVAVSRGGEELFRAETAAYVSERTG